MTTFDLFGWYAADQYPGREAQVAPANLSLTETPGELRANWTGHAWVDMPYVASVITSTTPVPQVVTRAQAKLALLQAGLLGNVQIVINAIPDAGQRAAAQIEWDDRLEFQRDNPTLIALATGMGMTAEQLDDLFRSASLL